MRQYHAHGKLLLSAEYLVMYGAKALAVPLKKGQSLEVSPSGSGLHWSALEGEKTWFTARFRTGDLEVLETSDHQKASWLKQLLEACTDLNPGFSRKLSGTTATTRLEFPPEYGWGSSSTLIALLAWWAGADPMKLHFRVSEGSGYDVACARAAGPILYQLRSGMPQYEAVTFNPPFSKQLWFAWLGKKQPTAPHLRQMKKDRPPADQLTERFSGYTMEFLKATDLKTFREVMEVHETVLSEWLGTEPLQHRLMDFPGTVKSLGAWGGDFMMIASELPGDRLRESLKQKGIQVVYSFEELVYDGP